MTSMSQLVPETTFEVPDYVWRFILVYLDFKDLKTARLVCKTWFNTIKYNSKICHSLTFVGPEDSEDDEMLKDDIEAFLLNWPRLKTIRFWKIKPKDPLIKPKIFKMIQWSEICPNLEKVQFWSTGGDLTPYLNYEWFHRDGIYIWQVPRIECNPNFFKTFDTKEITGLDLQMDPKDFKYSDQGDAIDIISDDLFKFCPKVEKVHLRAKQYSFSEEIMLLLSDPALQVNDCSPFDSD